MIAPPDHPFAGRRKIKPQELLREIFIGREPGSGTRNLMTRFLDRAGEGKPYETIEMSSNETIKQAVIAGLGIALMSDHSVVVELHTGRLVALDVPGLPIERSWYVLHRADTDLAAPARRIRDHISGLKGSFLPDVDAVLSKHRA